MGEKYNLEERQEEFNRLVDERGFKQAVKIFWSNYTSLNLTRFITLILTVWGIRLILIQMGIGGFKGMAVALVITILMFRAYAKVNVE